MAAEGLIEAIRTERVGRRPERTVYQITTEGRRELAVLRDRAIGRLQEGTDAVAAGLIFAGLSDPAALAGQRGMREGFLQPAVSPLQASAFRRSELHMQAELAWHQECDELVAGVSRKDSDAPGAVKTAGAAATGLSS